MAQPGKRKPTSKIVIEGIPQWMEAKVEEGTNAYPGRLVYKGSNDDDVIVKDATGNGGPLNKPVGFLGYERAHAEYKPLTVDTAYATNDQVPVIYGSVSLVARLSGASVTKGQFLTAGDSGMLTAMTSPQGGDSETSIPVARALETVDASTAIKDIAVQCLI